MTEETHRKWDIIFKWFGLLGVIFAGIWTFYTYYQNRKADIEKQGDIRKEEKIAHTKDQNSFIFQHQASLYLDAARSAATLALGLDPNRRDTRATDAKALSVARQRFEELYWGELVIVEDRRVEMAMVVFRECMLSNGKNCNRLDINQDSKRIDPKILAKLGYPSLLNFSLELAACTRSALEDDRDIDFGELKTSDDMKVSENSRKRSTVCPYD
jgi:hypothetical protein